MQKTIYLEDFYEENFDKKFVKSEISEHNVQDLIKKTKKKLELLEAMAIYHKMKNRHMESINGFAGSFFTLRKKYVNNIDTLHRCINRLYKNYKKL